MNRCGSRSRLQEAQFRLACRSAKPTLSGIRPRHS